MASSLRCVHDVPIDVCPHPTCIATRQLLGIEPHAAPASSPPRSHVDVIDEDGNHEIIESELDLPPWCHELRFDAKRELITLRAKTAVRLPMLGDRVATFDFDMTADHIDGLIDALTTLRDRARSVAAAIDVPSSESPPRSSSRRS